MPELPEVQTIVTELNESQLMGKKISSVEVYWDRTLGTIKPCEFSKRLIGQSFVSIGRRGKWIVFTFSHETILIHLRMTGKISLSKEEKESSHERLRLLLDDGRILHYEDQRKFGRWLLVKDPTEKLEALGLEPLDKSFTLKAFKEKVLKRKQPLKVFLLNQNYVSGLGNIYVDEALFESKLHPARKTESLSEKEISALHKAIVKVLSDGVENRGTSLGENLGNYQNVSGKRGSHQNSLKVFQKTNHPCSICGTKIVKITFAQRGTHLCPNCQKI